MADLRKAAQMALETLDNMVKVDWHEWDEFASVEDFVRWAKSRASFTAEALRAALAQPEQEPCIHVNNPKGCYRVRCQLGNKCVNDDMSFRTTPPQREWQELTDKEILADDVLRYHFALNGGAGPISKKGMAVIAAVNAKLKEKNNG